MKTRCLSLLSMAIIIPAVFSPNSCLSELLDGERLFRFRKKPAEMTEFMDSSDPLVATAALGGYLRLKKADLATPPVIEELREFIADGRDLDKTALLVSVIAGNRKSRADVIRALISSGASEKSATGFAARMGSSAGDPGLKLAAAMLAYNAVELDMLEMSAAGPSKSPKKKAAHIAVPASLFENTSDATRQLALLAAACSGDESLSNVVMDVKSEDPDDLGCQLYYMAKTNMDIPDRVIDYVVGKTMEKTATSPFGAVGRRGSRQLRDLYEIRLPGAGLACRALAVLGDEKHAPYLYKALYHDDHRVQMEAVRAIEHLWQEQSMDALIKRLQDCEWQVAVEICRVLSLHPDAAAVPGLVNRLQKESGYLRQHLVYALACIAGGQRGKDAEEWKAWWIENKDGFEVAESLTRKYRKNTKVNDISVPSVGYFYGLTIISDHFAYVVDSSKSMRGARIKSLKENLSDSVENLKSVRSAPGSSLMSMRSSGRSERVHYNIADFGGRVEIMDDENLVTKKRKGLKYVEDMPLTLGTRMFDALELAMSLPDCDTFYLLSDGAPIVGSLEKWRTMRSALNFITRYEPVAVYCVAFSPSKGNARQMKMIATEHFGKYGTAN